MRNSRTVTKKKNGKARTHKGSSKIQHKEKVAAVMQGNCGCEM